MENEQKDIATAGPPFYLVVKITPDTVSVKGLKELEEVAELQSLAKVAGVHGGILCQVQLHHTPNGETHIVIGGRYFPEKIAAKIASLINGRPVTLTNGRPNLHEG